MHVNLFVCFVLFCFCFGRHTGKKLNVADIPMYNQGRHTILSDYKSSPRFFLSAFYYYIQTTLRSLSYIHTRGKA